MTHLDQDFHQNDLLNAVIQELHLKQYQIIEENGSNKGDNYVGILRKLHIQGTQEDQKQFCLHLIFKQAPSEEAKQRKLFSCENCFNREFFMYETVLPIFSKMEIDNKISNHLRYAQLYATSKVIGSESLIIEDLTADGYEMKDRIKPLDLAHCTAVMHYFAKLHSFSFILKKRNSELFNKISNLSPTFFSSIFIDFYQNVRLSGTLMRISACLDQDKEKHIFEKVKQFLTNIQERTDSCFSKENANGYVVINHGDSWINNIFFKYKDLQKEEPETVCLIDWQLSRCATPMIDLTYFLYTATDKEFRDKHLDNLYNTYYNSLSENLATYDEKVEDHFPLEEFHRHIREFSKYGLLMCLLCLHVFLSHKDEAFSPEDIVGDLKKYEDTMMKKALNDTIYRTRLHDIIIEMDDKGYF